MLSSGNGGQKIVSKEQVLWSLKETILAYFFNIDVILLKAILRFSFQWWLENSKELNLVLSKVRLCLLSIHLQELRFDVTVLKFFILDLGEGVKSEISVGDIVDVEYFKNTAGALIERIAIAREESCLLLLLLGKLWLEADIWQPVALW